MRGGHVPAAGMSLPRSGADQGRITATGVTARGLPA